MQLVSWRIFLLTVVTVSMVACGGQNDSDTGKPLYPIQPQQVNTSSVGVISVVQSGTPLTIGDVSPSTGTAGTLATISGTGFTKNSVVVWNSLNLLTTYLSPTQLSFQLPGNETDQAISAVLFVKREDGVVSQSTQQITVEATPSPTNLNVSKAIEGQRIRIMGSRLKLVSQIGIGSNIVPPADVSPDGSWLDFVVPTGSTSGTVVVYDAKNRAYSVAKLTISTSLVASLKIQDVQVDQGQLITVSQTPANPYLRLVPGRATTIRVRLEPNSTTDVYQPVVKLTATNDSLGSQTFEMVGPATLSAASVAEDDMAGSYTYALPGQWIGPGFKFDVAVNEKSYPNNVTQYSYTSPTGTIKSGTYIKVHVVPIAPDTGQKVDFDIDWFKSVLQTVYPLSAVDVVLEPALTGPGTNDSYAWYDAINTLRGTSNPKNYDFFMGVLPYDGMTGLGAMPGRISVVSNLWYGSKSYSMQGHVMHELGHNFGRPHSFDDTSFPYADNRVGGPWASTFNQGASRVLVDPSKWYDAMSYSYPKTPSDYTYAKSYDYLAVNLPIKDQPVAAKTSAAEVSSPYPSSAPESLYITGSLKPKSRQATLRAPIRLLKVPDTVASHDVSTSLNTYSLEIKSLTGVKRYPLVLQEVGDATEPLSTFDLTIPAVDNIQSMQVLKGGIPIATLNAPQPTVTLAQPQAVKTQAAEVKAKKVSTPWGSYSIANNQVTLTWDAARWSSLSVWQKTANGLAPLAISASGGQSVVTLRVPATAAQGLVLSFGDGLNSSLQYLNF